MLNTKEKTKMKTLINKIIKLLPKVYGGSIFKSVETKGGFMIKCCDDLQNVSNPMDAQVNFETDGCDKAILTWKDTGKLLSETEAQKYWDASIWTDKPANELKFEDFLFISNRDEDGDKFISIDGTGYMGGFLTDYDCDFSKAEEFEKLVSDALPKKKVYLDGSLFTSFIRIQEWA
tara:strand:- start:649 stop:1176 length:528 start_codon:yes stop_codon:yes gene_type:complete